MSIRSLFSRLLAAALLMWSVNALAWWDEAWPYRLPISLDTAAAGANIPTDITNATVLVKLHTGNFQDFFLVKEDLADVRFIAGDDKTPLPFHVESFDLINQLIYIWVKVPAVKGNLNTERIWMYYGNSAATSAAKPADSFGPNVAADFHFNDAAKGITDSTANATSVVSSQAEPDPSSMIAGGIKLSGNGGVTFGPVQKLADVSATGMTVSFWMKAGEPADRATLLDLGDGAQNLTLVLDHNQVVATSGGAESTPATAFTPDSWHHVAAALSGQTLTLYIDGKPAGTLDGVALQSVSGFSIGDSMASGGAFTGDIDELRIDAAARSADEVKFLWASQSLMGNLLSYQQAEQLGSGGGGGSSFWSVIIGSTEGSGWTIIALLGLMALISWMVMLGKAIYIGSVGKDNKAFFDQYRQHANDDPALLDHADSADDKALDDAPILQAVFGSHDHFQSSPIYRVYHRGIQEVQSRMGTSVGARASGLNRSALDAIKAAIDAQMIREAQRLNSKMVLLTIAISGGPFLGLMGTVVGVMITFAAIAASGDVNISAIAPGVAAALLTTVAGLVVAIPALFGYNYLASRIKECISDMRVFSDELITRLAEHYGN